MTSPVARAAPDLSTEESDAFERALCVEQTRLHGDVLPLSLGSTAILAAVVTWGLFTSVPHPMLGAWLCSLVVIALARIVVRRRQRADARPSEPRWRRAYRIALLAQGCAWAYGGRMLFEVDTLWQLDLLLVALMGVAAGALLSTSFDRLAAWLYAAPMAVPLSLFVFHQPLAQVPPSAPVVALLVPVALAAMWRGHRALIDTVATRVAQAQRAAELHRAADLVDRTGAVAGVGGWELDATTRRLQLTPHALRLMDVQPDADLTLSDLLKMFEPGPAAQIDAAIQAALSGGPPLNLEVPMRTRTGRELILRLVGQVRASGGRVTGLDAAVQDVTRLHTIDRALADKHQLLEQVLRTGQQGFMFSTPDGLCTDLNPAMANLLGRSREDVLGRPAVDLFTGRDREILSSSQAERRTGQEGQFEITIVRPDGSARRCLVHGSPLYDARGQLTGLVGVWTDITERHQTEEALRVSEVVINASAEMISVVDEHFVYQMVNDAWCRACGVSREQAVGQRSSLSLHNAISEQRHAALVGCMRERRAFTVRDVVQFTGQPPRHLHTDFYPISIDGGAPRMAALVSRDITQDVQQRADLIAGAEYLRVVLESTGDAIYATDATDLDEPERFANEQLFTLWGIDRSLRSALSARQLMRRVRALVADPEAQARRIDDIVAAGKPVEDRVELTDGRVLTRRFACVQINGRKLRVWSVRDVTAEAQAVAQREAAAAEQRTLLENFPGSIAVFDADLNVQHVNARQARLLHQSVADIVGQPALKVLGDQRWRKLRMWVAQTRGGVPVVAETQYPSDDGLGTLDLEVTYVPGPPRPDGSQSVYAFGIDITERKRAQAALIDALAQAERANKAKSQFLSSMSHELRTPLNAVLGFGQLLAKAPLAAEQRHQVGEVVNGGRHLLSLINDLLDLGRIESGEFEVRCEPVDAEAVIADCLELLRPLAQDRAVTLHHRTSDGPRPMTWADLKRLRQVLLNLVSNAIKYNAHGGTVDVEVERLADALEFRVRDTGPGLSDMEQQRLFQPFERLAAQHSTIDGTGIGLALSRDLVKAMGGSIGVHSKPDQGSTFWFQLPLARAGVAPTLSPARVGTPIGGCRALYIEDNPVNLMLMSAMLEDELELVTASDPFRGLELAQSLQPDLILLDIQLPGIDGFEVLRRLRADPRTADIPVIAVSANAMPADLRAGQSAGFQAYVTKPVNLDELLTTIRELLARDPA
jgi:PAS domain S-box-containing protein